MKNVRLSPAAEADLEAIGLHFEEVCPRYGASLIQRIQNRCRLQARFPRMGRDCSKFYHLLRSAAVDDYLIFFRETSRRKMEVVRIIHGARDISAKDFQD